MTSLQCSFCPYRSSARLDLIKHSFGSHSVEPSFRFVCGISGCVHCFRRGATFESFKSHALRKHPRWQAFVDDLPACEVGLPEVHAQNPAVGSPTDLLSSAPFQPLTDTTTLLDSPPDSRPDRTPSTPQHTSALFLLTFKEKHRLSQKAIDYAVGSINTIVDSVCSSVQDVLRESLPTTEDELMACFDYGDPFSELRTEYQQATFYRQEFGLVVRGVHGTEMRNSQMAKLGLNLAWGVVWVLLVCFAHLCLWWYMYT